VIPAEKNRVFGLDILRATAIVLVLAAHTWPTKAYQQWPHAFAVLGVELFFVLSGFLIGGILIRLAEEGRLRTLRDVWGFWRRRWFRTLPNYYLFLGLHLVWRTWVLGFPDQVATNWEYLFFVQNLRIRRPSFFPRRGAWRLKNGSTCYSRWFCWAHCESSSDPELRGRPLSFFFFSLRRPCACGSRQAQDQLTPHIWMPNDGRGTRSSA
jgi:peptidoglycan/LPS O-acetylase OafA/YrhL